MDTNNLLKISVIVHFILTVWATTSDFLPASYTYMNLFVLLTGVFSIVHNTSVDGPFLFLVLHIFTILQDIIFLGIYQPAADEKIETRGIPSSIKNRYRFSLGMCILNLILKPVSSFLIIKVWQERQGNSLNLPFTVPGFGSENKNVYDRSDSTAPYQQVETASSYSDLRSTH